MHVNNAELLYFKIMNKNLYTQCKPKYNKSIKSFQVIFLDGFNKHLSEKCANNLNNIITKREWNYLINVQNMHILYEENIFM